MAEEEDGNFERRPLLPTAPGPNVSSGSSYNGGPPVYDAVPPYVAPPYNSGTFYGTQQYGSSSGAQRTLGPNEVLFSSTDDELPPAYTPSGYGTVPMIHCKVCQALINLEGRTNSHVVKCDQCQEATPIRHAPAGKKYVRCTCNCLLVCKAGARRVICPRPNCKKTILFGEQPVQEVIDETNARIICIHCQQTFLFNLTSRALARCPHCRKISSIGRNYSLKRARIFLAVAAFFFILAIVITVVTHTNAQIHRGVITVYVLLFLAAVVCTLRSIYYYSIKGSQHVTEAT